MLNKAKKATIRAVDRGTVYDVAGELVALGRSIGKGEIGAAEEVVVIVKSRQDYRTFGFGRGDASEQYLMGATFCHHMMSNRRVV